MKERVKLARKPMTIEIRECKSIYGTMEHIVNVTPDLYGKFNVKDQRIIGLKTHINKLIKLSLQQYEKYSIELFGEVNFDDCEKKDIKYLKGLIN